MNRNEILTVTQEMRERHVAKHFKSPTLIAWVDRIEAAVTERDAAAAKLIAEVREVALRMDAGPIRDRLRAAITEIEAKP